MDAFCIHDYYARTPKSTMTLKWNFHTRSKDSPSYRRRRGQGTRVLTAPRRNKPMVGEKWYQAGLPNSSPEVGRLAPCFRIRRLQKIMRAFAEAK